MKKMYRYQDYFYGSEDNLSGEPLPVCKISLDEYKVIKETPKGYWISFPYLSHISTDWKKWVSKTSRKRFAYPTEEEALNNFIARRKSRIRHLEYNTVCARVALSKAISIKEASKC